MAFCICLSVSLSESLKLQSLEAGVLEDRHHVVLQETLGRIRLSLRNCSLSESEENQLWV
jgi:hypothetical protein